MFNIKDNNNNEENDMPVKEFRDENDKLYNF